MIFSLTMLLLAYGIGSLPSGAAIARLKGVDIRSQGSGNIGATNVARVVGKKAGLLTLLVDLIKGLLAVILPSLLTSSDVLPIVCGACAVFGHCYPCFGLIRGGKGVATFLGVLIAFNYSVALISLAIFVIVFKLFKIVSLASCVAALFCPIIGMLVGMHEEFVVVLSAISFLILFRHHENLRRIIEGSEPRFAIKKGN